MVDGALVMVALPVLLLLLGALVLAVLVLSLFFLPPATRSLPLILFSISTKLLLFVNNVYVLRSLLPGSRNPSNNFAFQRIYSLPGHFSDTRGASERAAPSILATRRVSNFRSPAEFFSSLLR